MDCSLPGSSVHGILQTRILEWVAMLFSRDLADPGIKPVSPGSPALQAYSLLLSQQGSPSYAHHGGNNTLLVRLHLVMCMRACTSAFDSGLSWSEHCSQTAGFLRVGNVSGVSSLPSTGPGTQYIRVINYPSFPGLSQAHI